MSHDASEPKSLVETINDYEFNPEFDVGVKNDVPESVEKEATDTDESNGEAAEANVSKAKDTETK